MVYKATLTLEIIADIIGTTRETKHYLNTWQKLEVKEISKQKESIFL